MAKYIELLGEISDLKNNLDLKLDDVEKQSILTEMNAELSEIKTERTKYEEKWNEADKQDSGNIEPTDFPWDEHSNTHINLIRSTKKTIKAKAKKLMNVNPMMLCKNIIGIQYPANVEEIRSIKEQYENFKLLDPSEANLIKNSDPTFDEAILYGTGVLKVWYNERSEIVRETEYYTPTDIDKFINNFKDVDSDDYNKILKKLEDFKEPIIVSVKKERRIGCGLEVKFVSIRNLFVRDVPEDLNKHQGIFELHKMRWQELETYFEKGVFDKEIKTELAAHKDFNKRDYDVYESIWRYDYDKDGISEKINVVFLDLDGTYKWLAGEQFPYNHNEPEYVIYYIEEGKDTVYRTGIYDMLIHPNKAIDKLWNQTIDTGTLLNAPAFEVEQGSEFDPQVKKWGPAVIWWVRKAGTIKPLVNINPNSRLPIEYIDKMMRNQEFETGVSIYTTGQESPTDPRAPAMKAMMLREESNVKIDEYIANLQKGNVKVFQLADSLLQQYYYEDENFLGYDNGSNQLQIDPNVLFTKFSFVPQYSQMTLNKALERQHNLETFQFLMSVPFVNQNVKAIRKGLEIILRSMPDSWEKNIEIILPKEEEMQATMQQLQMAQQQEQLQNQNKGRM